MYKNQENVNKYKSILELNICISQNFLAIKLTYIKSMNCSINYFIM